MSGIGGARAALGAAAEPWEIQIGRDLADRLDTKPPSRWSRPGAAADDLADLVGPGEVVLAPSATRPSSDGVVWTPEQALGAGARGAALWVDDLPYPRIIGAIPYPELIAVEHAMAGKHSCLVLTGVRTTLVFRYRSWAWPAVADLLTHVRSRAHRPGAAEPAHAGPPSLGWERLPASPLVALGHTRHTRYLGAEPELPRRWLWQQSRPAAFVALTRQELVAVRHVLGRRPLRHGVQLLAVARNRITGLGTRGDRLRIAVPAGRYEVDLGAELAAEARSRFEPMLRADGRRRVVRKAPQAPKAPQT
ncbi:hypothetical protein G3I59_03630 [Amycolatopsis rubida]|uniref:Uncharacterized protein n=1 Tax=Amycolatopsis rubida TaxID=112413 RepID=A0ABX0BHC0_9PSEU|nr:MULTISPECIES: hypothetical protein [Amycolatopsis]MYW89736.1 hypothetical protein [Amycolatopsis rubida]NEC54712.1 hypothetical protein [Amycolatopsis rubida]OAP24353.1 hypothetical protein A4R44_04744 [Amycolatopsis sp. M39]